MPGNPRPRLHSIEAFSLAGLLLFTLVVRGGVLWSLRANLQQDPDAYREIAENLLRHGEFALGKQEPEGRFGRQTRPTAYRPPLYPVVLSNLPSADGQRLSLGKVAALHLFLGVATVWLTWLTAWRLIVGLSRREGHGPQLDPNLRKTPAQDSTSPEAQVAQGLSDLLFPLLAGLLVACDPILLNQQSLVMTETLAAFLAILSLWCLARFDGSRSWFNAALAGAAIGLAVLCRPTFLPWLGLVVLAMPFVPNKNSDLRIQKSEFLWRFGNVLALSVVAAGVLSPWLIRNYRLFHKPIATTTHGGYTFYLANNQYFYEWLLNDTTGLPWSSAQVDFAYGFSGVLLEAAIDQAAKRGEVMDPLEILKDKGAYGAAKSDIKASPGTFVWACCWRLGQLWSPLPYKLTADESTARLLLRYSTAVWYCGVYVLAAIGIWRLRWRLFAPPWIWGVLLCLAFTAVHTFYWTNLRMRAPLMPFVAMVAACSLAGSKLAPGGCAKDSGTKFGPG